MSRFGFEIEGQCFYKQDGVSTKATTKKVLDNYTRNGRTLPLYAINDNIGPAPEPEYAEAIRVGRPVYLCE